MVPTAASLATAVLDGVISVGASLTLVTPMVNVLVNDKPPLSVERTRIA